MKLKISKIVAVHYIKLTFRTGLFISALCVYIYNHLQDTGTPFSGFDKNTVLMTIIWVAFVIGMILRFFPSKFESMGCQKQFLRNYKPQQPAQKDKSTAKTTFLVVLSWVALNGIFGALYLTGVFDRAIMLLIALFYSVCDVICILFFCPFQTWIMKNKCCGTCRIYNWDYAMMFTPLLFVPRFYTWSLLGIALVLLIKWEYMHYKYPERFSENYNQSLSCVMCQERLCHQKVQLQGYLLKGKFNLKGNFLYKKYCEIQAKTVSEAKNNE